MNFVVKLIMLKSKTCRYFLVKMRDSSFTSLVTTQSRCRQTTHYDNSQTGQFYCKVYNKTFFLF